MEAIAGRLEAIATSQEATPYSSSRTSSEGMTGPSWHPGPGRHTFATKGTTGGQTGRTEQVVFRNSEPPEEAA